VVVFLGAVGLIVYTFVGYPALMAALARVRPRPVLADPGFEPRISLVVVAYNEEDAIEERLRNCLELDYPRERLELIVAADGSDDATADLARAHDDVLVLHRPERQGKLAAMQRAYEQASGEVVVFSDANNLYSRDALRQLAAPFADPRVGAVSGRKAIDDGSGGGEGAGRWKRGVVAPSPARRASTGATSRSSRSGRAAAARWRRWRARCSPFGARPSPARRPE
jgi:poly-beta-1,6-N-acetyl-D-glucosamine synthase